MIDAESVWSTIELTMTEMQVAALVAGARQASAVAKGFTGTKHGIPKESAFALHFNGVCAEIATARAMGVYWPPSVDTFRGQPDIPAVRGKPAVEVRWISQENYDLKLRKDDSPDSCYVLVSGTAPTMHIRGWIYGKHGMVPEFWTDLGNGRPPLWCVPKRRLYGPGGRNPMEESK